MGDDTRPPGPPGGDIPEVEHKPSRRISTVWIIPLVAVVIGAWIIYDTVSGQGPTITITFETAEGIEAEKTKIKFREVEVGVVESISLIPDLSGVVVTAAMEKGAEPHLTDTTRFWVVRPRIGAQGISGLSTLVSGAFIEVDPAGGGEPTRAFKGLEDPPVVKSNVPGREFLLTAETLGSITNGSPVYYHGLEVGEVKGYRLSEDKRTFNVHVFIKAPHNELVRASTRFWNVSGIEVTMDADGMKVKTESLQTLILGGIAFDTPTDLKAGEPSPEGAVFSLHETREEVKEAAYTQKFPWMMYFDGSVRGLSVGSPVEFRGIKVGSVRDIKLEFDRQSLISRTSVQVEIEPERISITGQTGAVGLIKASEHRKNVERLIQNGLRAQLKTGSFVTGQLLIDLDMHPQAPLRLVGGDSVYPEIPTVPSTLDEITTSLTQLIEKIEKLPLGQLAAGLVHTVEGADKLVNSPELINAVRTLDKTMGDLRKLVRNLDTGVRPELTAALTQANKTLATVDGAISEESPLRYNLKTTLEELAAAARSIRVLAEYLERNPNALIYGKTQRGATR